MIIEHQGKRPSIHPSAYIAPNAVVSGDVTIEAETRVLYGAVITAEGAPIRIGRNCVIMENAVVRASGGPKKQFPTIIGDYALVGPHAYVCGARLDYRAFIATNATILNGAIIGRNASVSIGAVVHIQTRIPDETVVPLKYIVIGDPCKLYAPNQADEVIDELMRRNFREYAFSLKDHEILAEHYGQMLGQHLSDVICSEETSIAQAASASIEATEVAAKSTSTPKRKRTK